MTIKVGLFVNGTKVADAPLVDGEPISFPLIANVKALRGQDDGALQWRMLNLLVLLPIGVVSVAVLLAWLWGWFVMPFGAPALGIWHAAGLAILVRLLVYTPVREPKDERTPVKRFTDGLAWLVGRFVFVAAIGWALHRMVTP